MSEIRVSFAGHGEFSCELGDSILDVALRNGVDLDHACWGVCACSTCHVKVERGAEALREASEDEEDQLDQARDVALNSRLGCQAKIRREGTIVVRISQESLAAYANEHPEAKG